MEKMTKTPKRFKKGKDLRKAARATKAARRRIYAS